MNAARHRSVALEKLLELRSVILEHLIKISVMPDHDAVRHWQKELHSYQTRLARYHKGKGAKPNFTAELMWEYVWEDQIDELPMGFVEEYGLRDVRLNFEDLKERVRAFINGVLAVTSTPTEP